MPFDLSLPAALWMALVCFGAAFVRGYSGFGFAAILIAGLSLVTDPLHGVGIVILSDIVMTAGQLRSIRQHISWGVAASLFAGALPAVPLGVLAMSVVGVDTGRALISGFILAMCAVLWAGWHLPRRPGRLAHAGIGVISGIAQGGGVGGLPVAAFFAAQPIPASAFRATIIAYFCLLDLWTLPSLYAAGRLTTDTLAAAALAMPIFVAGLLLGTRRFHAASPEGFRRFAIVLLAALALLGLGKALI